MSEQWISSNVIFTIKNNLTFRCLQRRIIWEVITLFHSMYTYDTLLWQIKAINMWISALRSNFSRMISNTKLSEPPYLLQTPWVNLVQTPAYPAIFSTLCTLTGSTGNSTNRNKRREWHKLRPNEVGTGKKVDRTRNTHGRDEICIQNFSRRSWMEETTWKMLAQLGE